MGSATSRIFKLDGGTVGLAAKRAAVASIDTAKMAARFIIATQERDRDGDVVIVAGCQKHLASYAANPRVLFNHDRAEPIGSCRDDAGALALEVFPNDRIEAVCRFHGRTRLSEQTFALVAAKELEAASIGFRPVGDVQPEKGGRYVIPEWELLEWSIVAIPANPEAIRVRLEKGKIDGEAIDPVLTKAFGSRRRKRRAWANGVLLGVSAMATSKMEDVNKAADSPFDDDIDDGDDGADDLTKAAAKADDEDEEEDEEEDDETKADDGDEDSEDVEDDKAADDDEEAAEDDEEADLAADLRAIADVLEEVGGHEGNITASMRQSAAAGCKRLKSVIAALGGKQGKAVRELYEKAMARATDRVAELLAPALEELTATFYQTFGR